MVLQMEAVECGAASLTMILAYYGKWLPLEQVREACGISRDGSSMFKIKRAAMNYGLDVSAYKVEVEELEGMEPAIIHWNFNHFVVFRGLKKGKVCLNDPGVGPVEVPMDEFRKSFTGVAMTFEVTDRFERGGRPTSILSYIKRNMQGGMKPFWLTFIFALLAAMVALVTPLFTKVFMDEILSGRNVEWKTVFFVLMGIVAIFNFIVVMLHERYSKRIAGELALKGNASYLRHLMRLPMSFFAMRFVGDLQQRQRLNETITHSLVEVLAPQIINIGLLVFYLVLMLSYNYTLTFIGVLAAIINLATVRYYANKRFNLIRATQQSEGKYFSATVSCLENIESIKAAGAETGFFEFWSGLWTQKFNKERASREQQAEMSLLPTLTNSLMSTAVLLIGAWYILQGDMSVGMLMAFQGFMTAFMLPVAQIVNASQQLVEMRSQMERVEDVMKYPEDYRHADASTNIEGKLKGELEMRNVTFGYSPMQQPLIENFEEMTNSLALVDQNIVLFDDTVAQNIRMWDQSIEDFAMRLACDNARIYDDLMERPEGFSTKVIHGGQNFSGGQRQRIEIATALARDPMIIIMDEATSALDPTTEDQVMRQIREMGMTLVVVAHRLSTIRDCDEIIVMDKGHILQRGTHEELMQQEGLYKQLMENT